MIQSGRFLGRLIGPLLKTGLPLIKNVNQTISQKRFNSFRINRVASAADAGIHKKNLSIWYNNTNNIK